MENSNNKEIHSLMEEGKMKTKPIIIWLYVGIVLTFIVAVSQYPAIAHSSAQEAGTFHPATSEDNLGGENDANQTGGDGHQNVVASINSQQAGPAGCKAKQIVQIDNSGNPDSLMNYQVQFNVSYLAGMSADFSDLRFTNISGAHLDYWIENYTASTDATVWIEVDSIPADDSVDIHMWYDSCTGGKSSNGDNTFLIFDDFNDGIYTNKWTPTGTVVESGGTLQLSGCDWSYIDSLTTLTPPVIMETRVRRILGNDTVSKFLKPAPEQEQVFFGTRSPNVFALEKKGATFGIQRLYLDSANNDWKEFRAILNGTTFQVYMGSQLDVWERNDSLTLDSTSDGMVMNVQLLAHEIACAAGEWDWVRVREYTAVEPKAEVVYRVHLPLIVKPEPLTYLYVKNINTGGINLVEIRDSNDGDALLLSCGPIGNNVTTYCGSFPAVGTYRIIADTTRCGVQQGVFHDANAGATVTRKVFCN
jgi:hypothetical protein